VLQPNTERYAAIINRFTERSGSVEQSFVKAIVALSAAFVMGFGSIGAAIGQGLIGMKGCENIGKYAENKADIRLAMLLALVLVETCAIYCLIIAIILILKTF